MPLIFQEKPWAIILAAGQGQRFSSATGGTPKQFLQWQNAPLYWHSALVMSKATCIGGIVFVFPANAKEKQEKHIAELNQKSPLGLPIKIASGGPLRQDSVRLGLRALPTPVSHVLIHDAARPFLSPHLVHSVCQCLEEGADAVVPALPVTDTIKRCNCNKIVETLARDSLLAIQTPQGFARGLIESAHEFASHNGIIATDDASLVEAMGKEVVWIHGEDTNCKITRPEDMHYLTQRTSTTRVGMGYDVHCYGGERPLKLGGVPIANAPTVKAHSDGDVLLHALMDALLGCAGLGDIGQHFPDTDSRYDNISSAILLDKVLELLSDKGITVCHVDVTVIAQKPRLAHFKEEIRSNLARLLAMEKEHINIKATTEEGLGFTGRLEGIKACVIATCEASYE